MWFPCFLITCHRRPSKCNYSARSTWSVCALSLLPRAHLHLCLKAAILVPQPGFGPGTGLKVSQVLYTTLYSTNGFLGSFLLFVGVSLVSPVVQQQSGVCFYRELLSTFLRHWCSDTLFKDVFIFLSLWRGNTITSFSNGLMACTK